MMEWLDVDSYDAWHPQPVAPVDPVEIYSPVTPGMLWLGAATLHWKKLLALLVVVLVLGGVAANATSPVLRSSGSRSVTPPPVEWTTATRAKSTISPIVAALLTKPVVNTGVRSSTTYMAASAALRWQPDDECSRVSRPVSARTMRWCPTVAHYLHLYGDWDEGDLTTNLRIIDCESSGRPEAVNRRSRATGLYQHLPRYWAERGAKAARRFGFDNPTITMPYDNIAVGVWLFETGGARHWPRCGRR